jgi:hypothetical protein
MTDRAEVHSDVVGRRLQVRHLRVDERT